MPPSSKLLVARNKPLDQILSKGVGCALSRQDLRKLNAVDRVSHMLDCKYHRKAASSIRKQKTKNLATKEAKKLKD